MEFETSLRVGTLVRRYRRFLADIVDDSGEPLTIHCPNPGAMSGCADPGSRVWYSQSRNTARKYAHTLELVETSRGELVGVNPVRANAIVEEALVTGRVKPLRGMSVHREVSIPGGRGRFDFRLDRDADRCYVEVKSVTWVREDGLGAFPDAKSTRASRHVAELQRMRDAGHRAVLLFCVQHAGVTRVTTADDIDPAYGMAVRAARSAGVEVVAYRTAINPKYLMLTDEMPIEL